MNGRDAFGGAVKEPPKNERTLSDMGISKKQSSNWQRLAKVPDEQFEDRSRCADFAHNRPPNFHENLGKN